MTINAIELMYWFTELPFAGKIEASMTMNGPRFTSEINLEVGIRSTPGPIPIEYAVRALYEMSMRMAQEKRYFLQWGRIFVRGTQRGIIQFQQPTDRTDYDYQIRGTEPLEITNSNNISTSEVDTLTESSASAALLAEDDIDEGKIFDSEDRQLMISFKFVGPRIAGSEVFTSILKALAMATEHRQDEVGASIVTYSASLKTSLLIHHQDSPRAHYRQGMTWRVLARALLMIWEQLVMGNMPGRRRRPPRYENLEFEVYRKGEKVGVGDLASVSKPNLGISVSK